MEGWTQLGAIPGAAGSLVESDLGWYAVGSGHSSDLWTSLDGQDWTEVTDTGFTNSVYQIWDAGPGLIAGGTTADIDFGTPLMWTSINGTSWTQSPIFDPNQGGVVTGLLEWRGQLLASGYVGPANPPDDYAAVWRSVDGSSWTEIPIGGDSLALRPVGFGDGLVLVGMAGGPRVNGPPLTSRRGVVWTSADGVNWTEHADAPALALAQFSDVTVLGQRIVVVGSVLDVEASNGRPTIWTFEASTGWAIAHQAECCGQVAHVGLTGKGLLATLLDDSGRSVFYGSTDGVSWVQMGLIAGFDGRVDGFAQTSSHGLVVLQYDATSGQTRLLLPPS
jgi:hypothetical protein